VTFTPTLGSAGTTDKTLKLRKKLKK